MNLKLFLLTTLAVPAALAGTTITTTGNGLTFAPDNAATKEDLEAAVKRLETAISKIQVTPSPTPKPSPTPSPTPKPTPQPTPVPGTEITTVKLLNPTTAKLSPTYVTFGQPFEVGAVTQGKGLQTSEGLPVQMDIKNKHSDGSVKFAVLTLLQPELAAKAEKVLKLQAGTVPTGQAVSTADLSGCSLSTHFGFKTPEAKVLSIDVMSLASKQEAVWLKGAQASQTRIEVPLTRAMRLIADVTRYADKTCQTDLTVANDIVMGKDGGKVGYDLTINSQGVETKLMDVQHIQYRQIKRTFYSTAKPQVHVQQDVKYLIKTNAVLPYRLDLGPSQKLIDRYVSQMKETGWNAPFASNGIAKYMPMTGGRGEIGSATEAQAVYLVSGDYRVKQYVLDQADAGAGIPWHFYDVKNGHWLSILDYPNIWTDGRGNDPALTQGVETVENDWVAESAHHPSLAYLPYILTGSRSYLDQLQAQASWAIVGAWQGARDGGKGLIVKDTQVRAAAWTLRDVDHAAHMSPDSSYEQAYFKKISQNNYDWLTAKVSEWKKTYGEVYGVIPGAYGGNDGTFAPWQQDYVITTLAFAARNGNAQAMSYLKDYAMNFTAGRFLNADKGFNPRDGVAYNLRLNNADGKIMTTWAEFGKLQVDLGLSNGSGWKQSEGNYGQLAIGTTALIYQVTKDPKAKTAFEYLMRDKPPFTEVSHMQESPNVIYEAP